MWVHMDGERRHVYISTANTLIQIQPASMTGLAKSSNWNLLCSRIFHIYYFRRMTPLGLGKAENYQIREDFQFQGSMLATPFAPLHLWSSHQRALETSKPTGPTYSSSGT